MTKKSKVATRSASTATERAIRIADRKVGDLKEVFLTFEKLRQKRTGSDQETEFSCTVHRHVVNAK